MSREESPILSFTRNRGMASSFREFQLERVRSQVTRRIPLGEYTRASLDLKEMIVDDLARSMVEFTLRADVLGKRKEYVTTTDVPLTWWDHLKQRFSPRWALRRYPVRMRKILTTHTTITHVCPHVDVPYREDEAVHLMFMESVGERVINEEEED